VARRDRLDRFLGDGSDWGRPSTLWGSGARPTTTSTGWRSLP